MEIKTKFNIGDVCYKITDNYKINLCVIRSIEILVNTNANCKPDVIIRYGLNKYPALEDERILFKNADEIINHFKQEMSIVEPDKPFYAPDDDINSKQDVEQSK